MKNAKRILLLVFILTFALCIFVACEKGTLKLSVAGDVTSVIQGQKIQFSTKVEDVSADGLEYEITSGAEHASISADGLLSVKADATVGGSISVISKIGKLKSNTITLTIASGYSIVATSKHSEVARGAETDLIATFNPAAAAKTVTWQITSGADNATLTGSKLKIKTTATVGATVKVKCFTVDGIESNEVTITVDAGEFTITAELVGKDTLLPGETTGISYEFSPEQPGKTAEWVIVEGSNKIDIVGFFVTAKLTATPGQVIIKAVCDGEESNLLKITIASNYSIAVSSTHSELSPESSTTLTAIFSPSTSSKTVNWEIVSGEGHATLSGNILTVKSTATIGATIVVKCVTDEGVESNEFTITVVNRPVITASAAKIELFPGESTAISYIFEPAQPGLTAAWKFISGEDKVNIAGNTLTVKAGATAGVVELKAVSGSFESNVLTITVRNSSETWIINFTNQQKIILNNHHTSSAAARTVEVSEIDLSSGSPQINPILDANVAFSLASGGDAIVDIDFDGYDISFTIIGHGSTRLIAKLENNRTAELVIECHYSPEGLDLHSVFESQQETTYAFSRKADGLNTGRNVLSPIAKVPAAYSNACQDIQYIIEMKTGENAQGNPVFEIDEDAANVQNGYITFLKSGIIRVTAKSASGNEYFAPEVSQIFEINEGFNVTTWEEFAGALQPGHPGVTGNTRFEGYTKYNGEPVNIVMLDSDFSAGREFSLAPAWLKGTELQSLTPAAYYGAIWYSSQAGGQLRINVPGSCTINGNGTELDYSDVQNLDKNNLEPGIVPKDDLGNYSPLMVLGQDVGNADNFVPNIALRDLRIVGNIGYTGKDKNGRDMFVSGSSEYGTFRRFLLIGGGGVEQEPEGLPKTTFPVPVDDAETGSKYTYVNAQLQNLNVSGFMTGIRISGALEGSIISDSTFSNMFGTGIATVGCVMTLHNMTYRDCGAVGVELTPDYCTSAKKQVTDTATINQQVKYTGYMESNNLRHASPYDILEGNNVVITLALAGIKTELQATKPQAVDAIFSNIVGVGVAGSPDEGKQTFEIVSLVFNYFDYATRSTGPVGPVLDNKTELTTSNELSIINFTNLTGKETRYKYIRITVVHPDPLFGGAVVGDIILANLNYGK